MYGLLDDIGAVNIQVVNNTTNVVILQGSSLPRATAAGTADAITATYVPALTLIDKQICVFVATGANTITNPTFAPDGLAAHTIVKHGGIALAAGDIPGALAVCILEYNLANTRWELLNPSLISLKPGGITFSVDNGTVVIPVGRYGGNVTIPFNYKITGWDIFEGSSTPIATTSVIDAWIDAYANYPPVAADSIWGGSKPTLTASIKNTATGLSITGNAGDVIAFNIDSNNNGKVLNLIIKLEKT